MKRYALLLTLLLIGQPSLADDDGGTTCIDKVELSNLLPPPPAAGSTAAQHDLQVVLATQQSRTQADMDAAKADTERSVFRFADALGSGLQPKALPKTSAFFSRVLNFDKDAVKDVKDYWKRQRPAAVSSEVHPLAKEKDNDWSYPSGHATFGYSTAVLLANMLPEKRAAIFARADVYAQHRIVMGAHFPSDVEAGHLAGTVIATQIMQDPTWRQDYEAARLELRHALGLPANPPRAVGLDHDDDDH
ncbi:acid phosphatase [Dyella caseinilytica]|uniref:Acid phosphatase n=1 Tax=Dyella caseinilytica TaxID=1849581 RepID=A0ABX7GZV3_9GAMM|nr:phosphatase PAP2 family protein [Dyella caseinilytica]QRN55182.1 phosphatase PAP2 family protein [Dyella caseinilytica]GFZ99934.1 acid phosphatase [Dyella caseinilytica]